MEQHVRGDISEQCAARPRGGTRRQARRCLPKKHMPMLFHSCAEFGVWTAATRYLTSATSMSEWSCEERAELSIDVCRGIHERSSCMLMCDAGVRWPIRGRRSAAWGGAVLDDGPCR